MLRVTQGGQSAAGYFWGSGVAYTSTSMQRLALRGGTVQACSRFTGTLEDMPPQRFEDGDKRARRAIGWVSGTHTPSRTRSPLR